MKAIILSAGQGKRLLPLTEDVPKCLLPVAPGMTMLSWQLRQLSAAGIDDITVLTGFHADKVDAELARHRRPGLRLTGLYNPFFGVADNLGSVWLACRETAGDFLLLNGDTLFEAAVPHYLLAAPEAPITVTISRKNSYDADDMKVRLRNGRLTAVGKGLEPEDTDGESIGLMSFRGPGADRFRAAVESAMRGPSGLRSWYLTVIDALAKESPLDIVEVGPEEWCEVDFAVDLNRARKMVGRWSAISNPLDSAAAF